MARRIAMSQHPIQNKGDRLEAAVRVRSERQTIVAPCVGLRSMMIEKQKGPEAIECRARKRSAGGEIADVVAGGGVNLLNCLQCRHEAYSWPYGQYCGGGLSIRS